jgi:hypothetical protein
LYLLKIKSDFFSKFLDFHNFVENQYNAKIKVFRLDNGIKFVNNFFVNFFEEKKILHQTSCVYTPEQNVISERKIDIY